MDVDMPFLQLISQAGFMVQVVVALLLLISVTSWSVIFRKAALLQKAKRAADQFENQFWSNEDLSVLYQKIRARPRHQQGGLARIFEAAMREVSQVKGRSDQDRQLMVSNARRAMSAAYQRELSFLEAGLSFLASTGSVSPYIGLFGTVWGVMNAFRGLATSQQATLTAVAPGISEALITTAIGLFAAIPAFVAYNRYVSDVEKLTVRFSSFVDEFCNILQREEIFLWQTK